MVETLAALGQHLIHELGLGGGAREPVEHGAVPGLGLRQLVLDEAQDHRVGDERPGVHVPLRFPAERRARLDRRAQDVASGDLGQPEPLGQNLPLRALARAWCA